MERLYQFFRKYWLIVFAFILLIFLTTLSSTHPDGLEWTAQKLGLKEKEIYHSPVADYTISEHFTPMLNQMLSAVLGILIIFTIFWLIKKKFSRYKNNKKMSHAT